jgi:DNA-binding NarL/FixJ family response regulator
MELTSGELDVLRLVAAGDDNQAIAAQLNVSAQTVANRLGIIYQKLQVNNRTQAALVALRRGWVELDPEA